MAKEADLPILSLEMVAELEEYLRRRHALDTYLDEHPNIKRFILAVIETDWKTAYDVAMSEPDIRSDTRDFPL